jgi:hypothetical protein
LETEQQQSRARRDALHALAAFIPDRAGDRVAIHDFCGHS